MTLFLLENVQNFTGLVGSIGLMIALFSVLYFVMIRPQKKQEKKLAEQRNNLKVGDYVITIGGIYAKVVNIKESDVTISTSVASTLLTVKKEAINTVLSKETVEK